MNRIKMFEAYTEDQYRRVLKGLKGMVEKNRKKEDVLAYINKYYSDDAKYLDNMRIILGRIDRMYSNQAHYFFYNSRQEKVRRGGVTQMANVSDHKMFFTFDASRKLELVNFFEREKEKYEQNISNISADIGTTIEFIFRKLFELIEFINETGIQKYEINRSRHSSGKSDAAVISEVESLNYLEFDNEYEEFKKLISQGLIYIKKHMNLV